MKLLFIIKQGLVGLLLIGLLSSQTTSLFAQNKTSRKTDSLQRLLKTDLPDQKKVDVLLSLIGTYIIKQPEKGYQQIKKALALAQKINYTAAIAQCYDRFGTYHKHTGEFKQSLEYHMKGLKIHEQLKNEKKIAAALGNIGVVHKRLKDYPTAFEYQFKALKLMKKLNETGMIANTYNNIGLIYLMTKDFPKALNYFDKTLELDKKDNFQLGIASDYSNIALAQLEMKQYNKALKTELKALKIRQKINHQQGEVISYKNLGYIYKGLKQYDRSLVYFEKYLALGKKLKGQEHIADAYEGLALTYEKQGRLGQALQFYKKFKTQQDSVFNLGKNKQVAQMKTRYETEKKEQENQVLRKEKKVQEAELAQPQLFSILIAIALLITLAFIYLGYRLFQQKKKSFQQLQQLNNEIKDQNKALQDKQSEILEQREEIAVQAEELKVTNEQLVQMDKFKQNLTSMIVHDLKNPLNNIIGLSEGGFDPQNQQTINQSGKTMLNLVMNILDVQRFEETDIKLNVATFALHNIVKNALSRVSLALEDKNVGIINDIPEQVHLKVDEALIIRVFVNLLTNAIKYTPHRGQITIGVSESDNPDFQRVTVTDNGVGIAEEFLPQIFDKYTQKNPGLRSTGLGLTFCKLVVERHDGQIGVKSKINKGSTFWFTLPKATEVDMVKFSETTEVAPNEVAFQLTTEEVALLKPIAEELRKFEIYEASAIKKTLAHLVPSGSEAVNFWCSELENTLYAWNETKYQSLLELVYQS